jgi:hypothetical protein
MIWSPAGARTVLSGRGDLVVQVQQRRDLVAGRAAHPAFGADAPTTAAAGLAARAASMSRT